MNALLQKSLGYEFKRPEILDEALTHASASSGAKWNERLEFLGDAVLSLGISTRLHARAEQFKEGDLSRIRAALVNEGFLAGVARRIHLGDAVRLGRGERKAGLSDRDSILADALEAVLGAVYLDGGFDAARFVVDRLFQEELEGPLDHLIARDFKTELQEVVQGRLKERPDYVVLDETGPQHVRMFTVAVTIQGVEMGRGSGNTKKSAAQAAAAIALRKYAGAGQVRKEM